MSSSTCLEAILPARKIVTAVNVSINTQIITSIAQIEPEVWDAVFKRNENLFLQHSYLTAIEKSHVGKINFRYALFTRGNKPIGIACFQLFTVLGKEALKESNTADTHVQAVTLAGRAKNYVKQLSYKRISKLRMNMLICGNALLTGEHGFYFNNTVPREQAFTLLQQTIATLEKEAAQKGDKIGLTLVKDLEPTHLIVESDFLKSGYSKINFQPNMVLSLQPEWGNFADYLNAMSSKYRVRTKRVLKKGATLERKDLTATEIADNITQIYQFYTEVADSMDFNLLSAQPAYFIELKKQLHHKFKLIVYCLRGEIVGFICAFIGNQHLEVHFTGYNHPLNRDYAIYSNILYDMVNLGIQNRVQTISFGRTALEIKSTVGATGVDMPAFIKHSNGVVNRFLIPLINQFNQAEWTPRHPFKHSDNEDEDA